jgi:hypothetical protein
VWADSWRVERFLACTQHKHNIHLVAAGLEEIGEAPVFVAMPDGSMHLYSQLPKEKWNFARVSGLHAIRR